MIPKPVVIVNLGMASGAPPTEGRYLKAYDPDWIPPGESRIYPRMTGRAWWTDDKAQAMRFPDAAAAFAEWKRQGVLLPTRPDGRPNRPLTAHTITIEDADEGKVDV